MNFFFNADCLEVLRGERFSDITAGMKVIIVTDPPFNIGYHYKNYADRMENSLYYKWLHDIFLDYPFVLIHYPESIYDVAIRMQKKPRKVISWVYNSNTAKQHRDIAFFDITPDFNKVRQPYKNPNDKRIKALIEKGKTGARLYDWWYVNQVKNVSKDKTAHPCQMPQQVMDNIVGILPKEGAIVVDPFMGSGTTGVACKKYGVDFIGIEKDADYFHIAVERIKNTGYTITPQQIVPE